MNWINVKCRLPEENQRVYLFTNIEYYNPNEAAHIRMVAKSVAKMDFNDRYVQNIELYKISDPELKIKTHEIGYAKIKIDDNKPYLTAIKNLDKTSYDNYIRNSEYITHWAPLEDPLQ